MGIAERGRYILNLDQYKCNNGPEHIGRIDLACPYNDQYVLRLLVKEAFSGYNIPYGLEWAAPLIMSAEKYQAETLGIRHSFVYVTIRHGIVRSVTDDEWHVDGFSMNISHLPEQNYLWSNVYPTEYTRCGIVFPKDFNPKK